ncbi:MAG: fused response regulator/phosphatase [SAR324 cluster bacterium]|nr:fused response regulator/phosphatase [SAR324 cluster bacterium]
MKILVVEDSLTQAFAMQRTLKSYGWEVILAKNGQEGLDLAREQQPDIILSDLLMPVMDGFEFCEAIKTGPLKTIPFILLSAKGELEDTVRGLEVGADDYLSKPAQETELIARIRSAWRIKEYQDEQQAIKEELEQAYQEKLKELEQAKVTQSSILPQKFPQLPGIQISSRYLPMDQIGGDFYDVVQPNAESVGFLVADVTGHGISAALISFMASSLFKISYDKQSLPSIALQSINDFLHGKIEDGKFVTAWYGIYHTQTRELSFASAAHPPAYLVRAQSREIFPLTASGGLLGPFSSETFSFETQKIPVQSGDKILIYTDGIIEIQDVQRNSFGWDRFEKLLLEQSHLSLDSWLDSIYNHVLNFSGQASYGDDITLLAFEIL